MGSGWPAPASDSSGVLGSQQPHVAVLKPRMCWCC